MQRQQVSQPVVARIMRKKNLRSVRARRFKQTTNAKHTYSIVENKLSQDFTTRAKNRIWVSDITYIRTREGWCYLTAVIDLFDRKVVGWHMSHTMRAADTVIPALNKAFAARSRLAGNKLIFISIEAYNTPVTYSKMN